jgi:hypothetical protein
MPAGKQCGDPSGRWGAKCELWTPDFGASAAKQCWVERQQLWRAPDSSALACGVEGAHHMKESASNVFCFFDVQSVGQVRG